MTASRPPDTRDGVHHPEWTRDAALYQINTRQFTPEGTLRAAEQHLPRLEDLGVGVLWLMPIHEIGARNRKGRLGSPYAVRDHYSVNPAYGDADDLRHFVGAAHDRGMRVILDWVANHTAWDHHLVDDHPEWYHRDWKGDFRPPPWWDWQDVIELDYRHDGLRRWMADAMTHWVREVDIDGYRCDMAGYVPTDFWNEARSELDAVKPVFMLAEWEARDLHAHAFDATYAWTWNEALHRIAHGVAELGALHVYYSWNERAWPRDGMRMTFVSNHDKNAWDGTHFEQFGEALEAAVVLSVVGEGMPLLHNGDEAGNERRLDFFDRDPIAWQPHPLADLYRRLFALKRRTAALWNGAWGARMVDVHNSARDHVLSFARLGDTDRVVAVLNLSGTARTATFSHGPHLGSYVDAFTGEAFTWHSESQLTLEPWAYRVFVA